MPRAPFGLVALGIGSLVVAGCATKLETADDGSRSQPAATTQAATAPAVAPSSQTPSEAPAGADAPVLLRSDHPERYTVQVGDTLWDISDRFLRDPWLWPEVWHVNPEIENPHLIYPGDVIELAYDADGRPRLQARRGERPTVKLSPEVRVTPLREAIPTIPLSHIEAFLQRSVVLDEKGWDSLPYVLGGRDDRPMIAQGERFYARGDIENRDFYAVFRPDLPYVDPDSGEYLGTAGLYVGSAKVDVVGDPAILTMTDTDRESLARDRLYPIDEQFVANFTPGPGEFDGRIIAVLDGVSLIGQYQSVVVNKGSRDGAQPGQVLAVLRQGDLVQDPYTKETVRIPEERAGLMMVYRVFEKVSYGLILKATRTMQVLDRVAPPAGTDL